ncbi:proteasome assembly chaperone 4 [Pistacia vera]|uniref:proteasome assembly chaperone 4 n=1 Tax=Pistacia vera TaxID=55513 RepID=UPI00126324B9|nr:proteasome assembly chaperone 4 [Pistacia vera]
MADEASGLDQVLRSVESMKVDEQSKQDNADTNSSDSNLQITCFSDLVDDVTLHFQIIRFPNQIYAWIGCNSAKFGRLYAAAPTRPNNTVSVSSILGGVSDNTGSGIARRLVIKTGLNVILACNIPKNSPMLEVNAEKKLVEKLISLGYTRPKSS